MQTDLKEIAHILGNGKELKTDEGFVTLCPCHEDKQPSLSIGLKKDGTLLVNCHAGCSFEIVRDELKRRGLMPEKRKNNLPDFIWKQSKPDPEAINTYLDSRNIHLDKLPACLRLNRYKGNMILVTNLWQPGDGQEVSAVQRTFLDSNYHKTDRKMLGECKGRAAWLSLPAEKMLFGEGLETVLSAMQATGIPGVSCMSTNGLKSVSIPTNRVKEIIVLVDSDPNHAGQKAARQLATRFNGKISFAIPDTSCFTDNPRKLDFNDLTPEQIKERLLTENLVDPSDITNNSTKDDEHSDFQFISFKDYMGGELEPPQWLIKNVLEKDSLAVLFGAPESYKSFLALDWGLSIASGTPWNNHAVASGPVFSIIGEGKNGYRRRVAAWMSQHTIRKDIPFFISENPAQFLDVNSAKAVGQAINSMHDEFGAPALVIIDTLARNFGPGHENDTRDMTTFISNLDMYVGRDMTRLIVHHSGLSDTGRSRGNSALRAALDSEYKMTRGDKGTASLFCTKMKDADRCRPYHFEPVIINLGGSAMEPITSLVLREKEAEMPTVKISTQQKEALLLLHKIEIEAGSEGISREKKVSSLLSEWKEHILAEKIYTRTAMYSAIDKLEDKKLIEISGDYVRLSSLSSVVLFGKQRQGFYLSSVSSHLKGVKTRRQTADKPEENVKKETQEEEITVSL